MQSLDDADVLFSVVTPEEFGVRYEVELSAEQVDALQLAKPEDATVLVMIYKGNQEIDANTHPLLKSLSANLRNPLVINTAPCVGADVSAGMRYAAAQPQAHSVIRSHSHARQRHAFCVALLCAGPTNNAAPYRIDPVKAGLKSCTNQHAILSLPAPHRPAKDPACPPIFKTSSATSHRQSGVLYMKGSAQFPQCGFSARAVQLLKTCGVSKLATVDAARPGHPPGIKEFSNWPTIPQLYINGEFIGGSTSWRRCMSLVSCKSC